MNKQRLITALLLVFYVVIFVSACTSIKYGSMPDTAKLSSTLCQNISTKDDVLKTLGPPRGYGKSLMISVNEPHVIWFYEYMEAADKEIKLNMLMVFFNKEIYAGHLWFSSFEKIEKQGN
jgi:hypothetical protein